LLSKGACPFSFLSGSIPRKNDSVGRIKVSDRRAEIFIRRECNSLIVGGKEHIQQMNEKYSLLCFE